MIRIVSDVHGKSKLYRRLIDGAPYSLQVGDLCEATYDMFGGLSPSSHRFFPGNHDNYNDLGSTGDFCLGDYGWWPMHHDETGSDIRAFFVRGAESSDREFREHNVNWWSQEELNKQSASRALNMYKSIRPEIMFSHDCPLTIAIKMHSGNVSCSKTQKLLEQMFEVHQPKEWYFGHHHLDYDVELCGTYFRCIRAEGTEDLPYTPLFNGGILVKRSTKTKVAIRPLFKKE